MSIFARRLFFVVGALFCAFPVVATPDLFLKSFTVDPSGAAGKNVNFSFTIINQGTGGRASFSTAEMRLSTSSVTPSNSDPLLLSVFIGDLAPGDTLNSSGTTKPIPASQAPGTYFIWMSLDVGGTAGQSTADRANDVIKVPFTVTGAAAPDLFPQSFTTPSGGAAGSNVSYSLTIVNQGPVAAGSSTTEIRLSTSSVTPNNSDPILLSLPTSALATGATTTLAGTNLSIPANTSPGTYYLWATLDASGSAGQGSINQANDRIKAIFTVTGAMLPDLVTTRLTANPASGEAGSEMSLLYSIFNQGTATANPYKYEVRLSTSSIAPGTSDPLLFSSQQDSLPVGGTLNVGATLNIPADSNPGTKYIWLLLDVTSTAGQGPDNQANDRSSVMFTVVTPTKPVASFTWSPQSPTAGQPVQFTDTSTGSPTSWAWNFGDGSNGSDKFLKNPIHTYNFPGPYFVSLIATNASGSNTSSTFTINVGNAPLPTPVVSFTWSPQSPTAGQPVQFTDTSTGSPTSWAWNFGDGSNDQHENPAHIYPRSDTYTVSLIATNAAGSSTSTTHAITVVGATSPLSITTTALNPPTATVAVPYAAQEAVAATGGQLPYSWSATGLPSGMGINATSGAIFGTPTIAGTFNFTAVVQDNSSPKQSTSKALTIAVEQPDCFAISASANPSNGGSATIQPVAPCFTSSSIITLKATPAAGFEFSAWVSSGIVVANTSSASTTGHLTGPASLIASFRSVAQPSAPFFDIEPANPKVEELVVFTDQSTDMPTSWSWDFDGDGKIDAQTRIATFSYARPGTYTARLTESNAHGSATTTRTVTVTDARPFLEFVDPNPDLLVGGAVTSDPKRLSSGGRAVFGASADGVTSVLLRAIVPGPGSVTFSLATASAQNDGALYNPLSSVHQQFLTLTVSASQISGLYVAFALYVPPVDFNMKGNNTGNNANDATRSVRLSAVFRPASGASNGQTEQDFYLVRPPLLLVHGIWSDATTWTMPLGRDARWSNNMMSANYGTTHAASYATNTPLVEFQLRDLIRSVRRGFRVPSGQTGIAVTQVDVVAHSMGGVLARRTWELRDDNYRAGDIHKLITLDSPHFGSAAADTLESLRTSFLNIDLPEYDFIAALMLGGGWDITGGAVEDLATTSQATRSLPATDIPSHAIVGAPPFTALCLPESFIKPLLIGMGLDGFALGAEHDGLVARSSQEGGLPSRAVDTPVRTSDGCHTHNTSSPAYSERAITLLNTPITDQLTFGHFPRQSGSGTVTRATNVGGRSALAEQPLNDPIIHGHLHLNLVTTGSGAGSVIKTSVQTADEVTSVIYIAHDTVATSSVGPDYAAELTVPAGALGTLSVQAFAIGPGKTYYDSDRVDVALASPGMPQELTVTPTRVQMARVGETRQISIAAMYPDSVWRDVTGNQQAMYASSAPEVASVSAAGLVVARGVGSARVSIGYGGLLVYITVYVDTADRRRAVSH